MREKKHIFSFFYLVVPVCFFIASIIVGMIRGFSLVQVYDNGLGMVALYYFIISLIISFRWNYYLKSKRDEI